MKYIDLAIHWTARMLSESDGTPSSRRVVFVTTMLAAVFFAGGLFVRHGQEALAVQFMNTTMGIAAATYGITKTIEIAKGEGAK